MYFAVVHLFLQLYLYEDDTLKKCTWHLVHQPLPVPLRCLPPLTTTQGGGGTTTICLATAAACQQQGGGEASKSVPGTLSINHHRCRCAACHPWQQHKGEEAQQQLPGHCCRLPTTGGGRGVTTHAAPTNTNNDKGEGCRCLSLWPPSTTTPDAALPATPDNNIK